MGFIFGFILSSSVCHFSLITYQIYKCFDLWQSSKNQENQEIYNLSLHFVTQKDHVRQYILAPKYWHKIQNNMSIGMIFHINFCLQSEITPRIPRCSFYARLRAPFNLCPIYIKRAPIVLYMHKKFEVNQTKIKSYTTTINNLIMI